MERIPTLFSLVLLVLAPVALGRYGAGDPRLERLFNTFISPCCWRENLTVHDSEIAHELRSRIQTMVRDGRSDDEIKAVLVKEYTRQILAVPDGSQGAWLFLTPWVAFFGGAAGVLFLLNRWRTHTAGSDGT
jgi:cytochrome c-type biogenesis protein CcmH